MPAYARSLILDQKEIGYYHCILRCVRRAFLCGIDSYTGKNFEHRKEWILGRLGELADIFFIDIGHYSIMDNHLHLVLKNRPDLMAAASDEEVIRRWWKLFPQKVRGIRTDIPPDHVLQRLLADQEWCAERRRRLGNISWLIRCLAEYISRKANKEDGVTGRFWEGRFRSVALLDEEAVRNVCLYVDLNPFRAKKATNIDDSDHTSLQKRWLAMQGKGSCAFLACLADESQTKNLSRTPFLSCTTEEYVSLALNLMKSENDLLAKIVKSCPTASGSPDKMRGFAKKIGVKRLKGTLTYMSR